MGDEERIARYRRRAHENIDAAGLRELYSALEDDNLHAENELVQRLANTVADTRAVAAKLAHALECVEWAIDTDEECPDCHALRIEGRADCHADGCAIHGALAAWRAITKDGDGSR